MSYALLTFSKKTDLKKRKNHLIIFVINTIKRRIIKK